MKFISEDQSAALIDHDLAYIAARDALVAATRPDASIFPAVIAHVSESGERFSVKSGASPEVVGLKVGSFWPGNDRLGMPRHSSSILLIDRRTGRIEWVIEASEVNAYRTAAVDAVAVDALARTNATTLVVFGAGHQAKYECLAISRVRAIDTVLVVARDGNRAAALVEELLAVGLSASVSEARGALERADIVVTATSSRAPLFEADWIRPGTHLSAMGADAKGKQELPPELFGRAGLFCDLPAQSAVMGEFQHFRGGASGLTAIGRVLTNETAGRVSDDQITVFDSSGIALQDLFVARHLVAAYEQASLQAGC
jgi:ornithine cyclodeaminase